MDSSSSILERLPPELIEHIVSILDQESLPPSLGLLHEPPSESFFRNQNAGPLKCLSLTCRMTQFLVAPKLYKHLRISADQAQDFADGYGANHLSHLPRCSESLLLFFRLEEYTVLTIDSIHEEIDYLNSIRAQITRMVDIVDPRALTIVASPTILSWLLDHPINMTSSWAFNIPYQMIRLEQGVFTPKQWFPRDVVHDNRTLSTVRPWNHCTYNEGSFISAYTHYEYFHFDPISLHQRSKGAELECHALHFACLLSFKLVAVFPFNHILNTCYFLKLLPNLEHLAVQLAPLPEDQNPCASTWPASCPSDFWLELEETYDLIFVHVNEHLETLSKFTILDYAWPGYRTTIDRATTKLSRHWKPNGNGVWTRHVSARARAEFASRERSLLCPGLM